MFTFKPGRKKLVETSSLDRATHHGRIDCQDKDTALYMQCLFPIYVVCLRKYVKKKRHFAQVQLQISAFYLQSFEKADCTMFALSVGWSVSVTIDFPSPL